MVKSLTIGYFISWILKIGILCVSIGLVYCMDYLEKNIDWLESKLKPFLEGSYKKSFFLLRYVLLTLRFVDIFFFFQFMKQTVQQSILHIILLIRGDCVIDFK